MVVVKTHLKGSLPRASLSGICRLSRGLVSIWRRGCFRFTRSIEACSSAHHWGRAPIELGHEVRLMRHRARELLAGQRTAALNALRGHLAEIGLIAPQGAQHAYGLKRMAVDGVNESGAIVVPDCVRGALRSLVGQIDALDEAIGAIDRELAASVKADETAKRLRTIPGVGPGTASAIVATIQAASGFASGREFAAFLGLTPRQNSTGGKTRLGRITKMGDRYLRKLLVVGACATLRHRRGHNDALRLWARGMLERKTVK